MILIIDNYDSFVHNLARYVREAGCETHIIRNDAVSVDDCLSLLPEAVIISPGPNRPEDAGLSLPLINALAPTTPLLGVCLGHQCLVEAMGGRTIRAREPLHGEASMIAHNGIAILQGLPSPLPVGRYHSLISELGESGSLEEIAWSAEGELMAVRHCERPWFGVQFHPESILTPDGRTIIQNFLNHTNNRASV